MCNIRVLTIKDQTGNTAILPVDIFCVFIVYFYCIKNSRIKLITLRVIDFSSMPNEGQRTEKANLWARQVLNVCEPSTARLFCLTLQLKLNKKLCFLCAVNVSIGNITNTVCSDYNTVRLPRTGTTWPTSQKMKQLLKCWEVAWMGFVLYCN